MGGFSGILCLCAWFRWLLLVVVSFCCGSVWAGFLGCMLPLAVDWLGLPVSVVWLAVAGCYVMFELWFAVCSLVNSVGGVVSWLRMFCFVLCLVYCIVSWALLSGMVLTAVGFQLVVGDLLVDVLLV